MRTNAGLFACWFKIRRQVLVAAADRGHEADATVFSHGPGPAFLMNKAPVWEPQYCSGFGVSLGRKQKELHTFLSNPNLRDTPRFVVFKNTTTNRVKISEL